MNFGKLLATGKSIINGRGATAYRENPHVYLPKFDSAKNPFAKPATVSNPPPAAPAPGRSGKAAVIAAAVPAPALVLTPAKNEAKPDYSAPPSALPHWVDKFNPMAMFRGSSGSSVRMVTAVQTELSLDSVKVIENDMRDAEVEVVPIKSRPGRAAGEKSGEPTDSWNDLGTKIFGTNAV